MTMDSFEKVSLSTTMEFCADPVTVYSNLGALIDKTLLLTTELNLTQYH